MIVACPVYAVFSVCQGLSTLGPDVYLDRTGVTDKTSTLEVFTVQHIFHNTCAYN